MKLVTVEDLREGDIIASDVLLEDYTVVLSKGTVIKSPYIDKLREMEIFTVYIEEPGKAKSACSKGTAKARTGSACTTKTSGAGSKTDGTQSPGSAQNYDGTSGKARTGSACTTKAGGAGSKARSVKNTSSTQSPGSPGREARSARSKEKDLFGKSDDTARRCGGAGQK